MQATGPQYLLYAEAEAFRWKFMLQSVGSEDCFTTADHEPDTTSKSRLELLAVVRGLEALDGPSRVTLVTRSRYVSRGICRELTYWREKRWHWERFGRLVPIRDHDLWQRVDRALEFHQVECFTWRFEETPNLAALGAFVPAAEAASPELGSLEPALLIVPRTAERRSHVHYYRTPNWAVVRAFQSICDGILAPFSAILRPAFTRAA
ncbi:MAG TPA: RNase H family protein [Lacipirellulaceae bacterium]|jgi:ribonuclease HI|nr:RNase H family protein [Lacipirellulaceae bacterium]